MALVNPSRATGELFGPVGGSVTFGFITDTHHDPIKTTDTAQGGKYYQDAVDKITDITAIFNARTDLSFVFQNGDFIDGAASASAALTDLKTINDTLAVNVPKYHNLGNHEVTRLTKEQVMSVTGQPAKWYSFSHGDVTFIVLDGNFRSDDDSDDLSVSQTQTGVSPFISYIPPTQRQWLSDTIAASPYPCVIFCHYPIYYTLDSDSWELSNDAAVRTILESFGDKVIGCICGHRHDNFIATVNGILYATLHATTCSPYPALNYAIITVYPHKRKIKIVSAGVDSTYVA